MASKQILKFTTIVMIDIASAYIVDSLKENGMGASEAQKLVREMFSRGTPPDDTAPPATSRVPSPVQA